MKIIGRSKKTKGTFDIYGGQSGQNSGQNISNAEIGDRGYMITPINDYGLSTI